MELYEEILIHEIRQKICCELDVESIIHSTCYQALQKIKAIIADDSLDDPECFMRIEQIVCVLEDIGSNGGCRHDFG